MLPSSTFEPATADSKSHVNRAPRVGQTANQDARQGLVDRSQRSLPCADRIHIHPLRLLRLEGERKQLAQVELVVDNQHPKRGGVRHGERLFRVMRAGPNLGTGLV